MSYKTFEDLDIWKKGRVLKLEIRDLVKSFPPVEKYRLTDQLIRSSRSIGTQIAEGHGRRTYKDRLHYTIIARGSLSETLNHLIDSLDEGLISEDQLRFFREIILEVERLMNGYIKYLESKISK